VKRKLDRALFTFHIATTPPTMSTSTVGGGAVVDVVVGAVAVVGAIDINGNCCMFVMLCGCIT
jgi:hypothetical protein